MTRVLNRFAAVTILLGAAFGAAACDDQTGLDANLNAQASLSFAATGGSTLQGDTTPPQNPVTIDGHVIQVTNIELRLSELEIEGRDDAKMEMRGGIIVVALPVDGSLVTPISATVAAGTYDELELEVRTVRVQGTFDGQPFDVTVNVDEELETAIDPPLVVTETGQANLTVAIRVNRWFRNGDGTSIDLLNLTTLGRSRLANNIEASFDAFDDDDRSGHHDHHDDDDDDDHDHSGPGH
jgi:hypothetical protein